MIECFHHQQCSHHANIKSEYFGNSRDFLGAHVMRTYSEKHHDYDEDAFDRDEEKTEDVDVFGLSVD